MKKKALKKLYLNEKTADVLKLTLATYMADYLGKEIETQARDYLILTLSKRGITVTEIADLIGLNKSTVSRIISSNKSLLK